MKTWYRISVLAIVVVLLAISAYVVLGVGDPGVSTILLYQKDPASSPSAFYPGYWKLEANGFYSWYDQTGSQYIRDPLYYDGVFTPISALSSGEIAVLDSDAIGVLVYHQAGYGPEQSVSVFSNNLPGEVVVDILYEPEPEVIEFTEGVVTNPEDLSPIDSVPHFTQLACQNPQDCQDVDFIWNLISSSVSKANQIWKPQSVGSGTWVQFTDLYQGQEASSGTVGSEPISGTSLSRQLSCEAQHGGSDLINAFLDTVAYAEGGTYNKIVGGDTFSNFNDHPYVTGEMQTAVHVQGQDLDSTAAGRYQFVHRYGYTEAKEAGYFPPFGPEQQDKAGWYLATLEGVTQGNLQIAFDQNNFRPISDRVASVWASFPYSPADCHKSATACNDACQRITSTRTYQCGSGHSYYGQPTIPVSELNTAFRTCYAQRTGQTLATSGSKVLLIGASHTTQNYGKVLHESFVSDGNLVRRHAVGGSRGWHWLNGYSYDGTVEVQHLGNEKIWYEDGRDVVTKPRTNVPLLRSILTDFDPNIVVISLGTNMLDDNPQIVKANTQNLAQQVTSKGKRCFWVGPGVVDPTKVPTLASGLAPVAQAIQEGAQAAGCQFIDARSYTSVAETQSDGYHYTTAGGRAMAQGAYTQITAGLAVS